VHLFVLIQIYNIYSGFFFILSLQIPEEPFLMIILTKTPNLIGGQVVHFCLTTYTTKTLAPEGGLNHSKVVIRNNEKTETEEARWQMCHLPTMGTDGTSGHLIPKTSRNLLGSTASLEQRRRAILSDQDF